MLVTMYLLAHVNKNLYQMDHLVVRPMFPNATRQANGWTTMDTYQLFSLCLKVWWSLYG
jgi:hypothetical protein